MLFGVVSVKKPRFHVLHRMEIPSLASSYSSYLLASSLTLLSLFLAALLRFSQNTPKPKTPSNNHRKNKPCDCRCSCATPNGGSVERTLVEEEEEEEMVVERQATGASMMEQLVPEITTHALSYLDYPSLCRLSMTNSSMRKAANDDNAWKALYHKDFTLEQDSVTPVNGWKAYYAATRAIMNVNREFFNIIRERSVPAMSHFWLNADYVKCIHANGEFFSGYTAVIQSWQLAFSWAHGFDYQLRDVRARVLTDMAWLTMVVYFDLDRGPFHVTNVFEFHNGQWFMVHHHSTVIDGEVDQQVLHA